MNARIEAPGPLLSVVIVNFNAGAVLVEVVASVLTSRVDLELLISDNGSTDCSLERIRERFGRDGRLAIVENRANLGFSRANNIALRRARGRFYLILNPDCILRQGTLEKMIQVMERCPEAGMAGCLIRNPDGSEQAGCRRTIPTPLVSLTRFLHIEHLASKWEKWRPVNLVGRPLPTAPVPVEAISGAFMLIRHDALEQVGLLDEDYFLHCEDLDWFVRFRQTDWQILFVPDVEVVHYKGTCSQDRPLFVLWHKHKGMVRFFRKFQFRSYPLAFSWFVIAGIWTRFSLVALVGGTYRLLGRRPGAAGARVPTPCNRPVSRTRNRWARVALPTGLEGRRVLVTGATGFIGQHLVSALETVGAEVSVLVRSKSKARRLWSDASVHLLEADVTDPVAMRDCCKDIEVVFHLASYSHALADRGSDGQESHHGVTEEGTRRLLRSAIDHGVERLVFLSSVKAMAEHTRGELDETAPPLPESPYGRSKLAAEQAILEAGGDSDLQVCILRLPMVFGPGNKGNLPRMIDAIARGRFPPWPKIANKRSAVDVRDVVRAALLAAVHERAAGEMFLVTEGAYHSTRWLYEQIAVALGRGVPGWTVPYGVLYLSAALGALLETVLQKDLPFDLAALDKLTADAAYSSRKIERLLGFRAHYSLASEIPSMIAEYRQRTSVPRQGITRPAPVSNGGKQ